MLQLHRSPALPIVASFNAPTGKSFLRTAVLN
jgi:hypothetical protein